MSDAEGYPVTVAVTRGDGTVEQVRVGTAFRSGEGFTLELGKMAIGATPVAERRPPPIAASGAGAVFPNYGRSKGAPISGATLEDLEYYAAGARRTLADPAKARFHDKERVLLAAIEAELARQRGVAPMRPATGDEPPPLTDEDIPF
jgi:hypothetical protein